MINFFTESQQIKKNYINIFNTNVKLERRNNIAQFLANITGKFYTKTPSDNRAYICLSEGNLSIKNIKKEKEKEKNLKLEEGYILFIDSEFDLNYKLTFSKNDIEIYYEKNISEHILKTIENRIILGKILSDKVKDIKNIREYINDGKILGEGSFGKVCQNNIGNLNLAVKISTKDKKQYYIHEKHILELLNNLILAKRCPNLPYVYSFMDEPMFFMELATGTFNDFLNMIRKKSDNSMYLENSLFQLMAGLHAIQDEYQIWNYDIKKSNILYYKIEEGGYWKYTILGKDYFLPNMGFLLVLNDFGISQVFSPKYIHSNDMITKNYGTRVAKIIEGKFEPLNIDNLNLGKQINVKWDDNEISKGIIYDKNKNISSIKNILLDSNIPPFEFYNDTQDILRIYAGGTRASQYKVKEPHKRISFCDTFIKKLDKYIGIENDTRIDVKKSYKKFSKDPSQVVAGYFIKDFFQNYNTKPIESKLLETYKIS